MDDRLDPDLIQANLKTRRIGRRVLVYDRTSSTNDVAAEYARNPANDGLVIFAEQQTAGRGRAGATWHSDHGDSLLFSVLLIECGLDSELLPLACAVAVAEAIGQVGGHTTRIKWPNDLMLADRKVGGILLESSRLAPVSPQAARDPQATSGEIRDTRYEARDTTVIGIGINCHQQADAFPREIRKMAVSLDMVSGARCHRITLARRVLTSLDDWLGIAERRKQQIIDAWGHLSTQLGRHVTVSYNGKRFAGHCIGVDPQKGLILQLDRGGVRMFDAAHTTVVR